MPWQCLKKISRCVSQPAFINVYYSCKFVCTFIYFRNFVFATKTLHFVKYARIRVSKNRILAYFMQWLVCKHNYYSRSAEKHFNLILIIRLSLSKICMALVNRSTSGIVTNLNKATPPYLNKGNRICEIQKTVFLVFFLWSRRRMLGFC